MSAYQVIVPAETMELAASYLQALKEHREETGFYLSKKLKGQDLRSITTEDLLERLIQTKQPQIFAESAVIGDGQDWNSTELTLLGDISVGVQVTIFDNGQHQKPLIHSNPFDGFLLYTPGALLRNDQGKTPADWNAVVEHGALNYPSYYKLYERRLLPLLIYANECAKEKNKEALITIPGLGCGLFAGKFQGKLGALLEQVLVDLLTQYGQQFSAIKALYYDPYNECADRRFVINGIDLLVRPLLQNNKGKSQLSKPIRFEEKGDDFSNCLLFSMVAWDHVSWPGNDFYINARATDDGVKAAATDSMRWMTGVEGEYQTKQFCYLPPAAYVNWKEVIIQGQITIKVKENLRVLPLKRNGI